MKKLSVLLVCQNYYPFIGGVEVHARQVAHELAKDHGVEVVAMNFSAPRCRGRLHVLHGNVLAPSYAGYQDGRVPIHSLTPSPLDRLRMLPIALRVAPRVQRWAYHPSNRFGYRFYRAVYQSRLKRLMERMSADVVHSLAGGYLGWTAQAAARELGIPFVCTPFVHPRQWGDGPDDIAFYRRSQAVIGLVSTDAQYLASIGVEREKLHVIGVSPELPETTDAQAFRARHGLAGMPVVLYIGRMMPQKGATSVLAAAPKVWQACPQARFVFIGPANQQEAAAFDGADPRIKYLGKVSLQEKADALAACDLFCMPSMSEILPTVYLEAWSYGKPVVGGRAHGLPELVEANRAGMSVSQEPQDVATALERLLNHDSLRKEMGARGRELVQSCYAVPAVTAALLSLYRQVTGDSVRAPMTGPLTEGSPTEAAVAAI